VIPGVDLKLQQAVDGTTIAPVTITVASDSSKLQSSIKDWVTAYNAVIDEINTSTQAPVVGSSSNQTTGQQTSTQLTTGGVLFNNQNVLSLRDRLVSLVSSLGNTGSTSYNSLASIGLTLDSSFTVSSASATSTTNSTAQTNVSQQTFAGTSGRLKDLDTGKLSAALSVNANAVAKLFTGTTSLVGQLGSYLSDVSGLSTQLTGALAGKGTTQSLFKTLNAETTNQITSLQQQIQLVTDQANLQADMLRKEFTASEAQVAQLQSMQSSLGALTAKTTG
jgi:flagellar hook-associated protein 2